MTITELLNILWNRKYFIISLTSIVVIIGILVVLNMPNIYTSSATLKLSKDPSQTQSSSLGSLGTLASVAGVGTSAEEVGRMDELFARLQSRDFLKHILTFHLVRQNITASKGFNSITQEVIYDEEVYDLSNNKWVGSSKKFESRVPSFLETREYFYKYVGFYENKLNGLITIEVSHHSPVFAKDLLNLLIDEVNNISRLTQIEESEESLEYLTNYLKTINNRDIKTSINQIMLREMQNLMHANVKKDFILEIIDNPFVPEKRSSPKRTQFVLMAFLVGVLSSIFFIILKDIIFDRKLT
tara:strand:- start:14402 stop:15298 length:897 start_codon:yes stop_codon:yes gene_type:complete